MRGQASNKETWGKNKKLTKFFIRWKKRYELNETKAEEVKKEKKVSLFPPPNKIEIELF